MSDFERIVVILGSFAILGAGAELDNNILAFGALFGFFSALAAGAEAWLSRQKRSQAKEDA